MVSLDTQPKNAAREDGHAPVRVLVADDHPLFRRGLVSTLQRGGLIRVVAEADNGLDALRLIDELEPDVAVLDLRMPELSGAEVCARLAERGEPPRTALLVLSAYEDPDVVWSAVSAGIAGYVGKSASAQDIRDAVLRVAEGGIAYSDMAAAGFAKGLARHILGDSP
jgi:two-component system, NarL family, nitrate/nitrite response regulator NarL